MQTEMKIYEFLEIWKILQDNKIALVDYQQKPIDTDKFIDVISQVRDKILELQTHKDILRTSSDAKSFKDKK